MAVAKKKRQWMSEAVKRPGELGRKAAKAGKSTSEFAREHKHDTGLTGQQARFARVAAKLRNKKKRRSGRGTSRSL